MMKTISEEEENTRLLVYPFPEPPAVEAYVD